MSRIPTYHHGKRNFGTGFEMMERILLLEGLVKALLDNEPDADAGDGVSVLQVWRSEATRVLDDC